MNRISKIGILTFIVITLSGFSLTSVSDRYEGIDGNPVFAESNSDWAETTLNSLTLEEKIGQLFFVAAYSNLPEKHTKEIKKLIRKQHIGGLIFFQGGPVKQVQLTNEYQQLSKIPLMVAMDAEWGPGMRLDSVMDFPYQMMLGAIQDESKIYDMGEAIAAMLSRLGVHMNFAPVVDVNTNPDNPVINHRSFGEDKVNVCEKAFAYMKGMQDNRVLAVAKHFPGHGNTSSDSHYSLPLVYESKDEIMANALVPFQYLINKGVAGVMVAHLAIEAYDTTMQTPSSLSASIVDTLLRQTLGFSGLAITDALNMQGAKEGSPKAGEIELKALTAGEDILVMSEDVPKAIKAIKKAIKDGLLTEADIDEKVKRILMAKQWCGLNKTPINTTANLVDDLNASAFDLIKRDLTQSAITLLKNENDLLPLKSLDTLSLLTINIGEGISVFSNRVANYATSANYNLTATDQSEIDADLEHLMMQHNLVLINFNNLNQRPYKKFGFHADQLVFAQKVAERIPTVLLIPSNPYALNLIDSLDAFKAIVLGYDNTDLVQDNLAQAVFGALPVRGKLPVSLKKQYKAADGQMLYASNRLGYTIPESVGLRSDSLAMIDSIVAEAIELKATPGCQVLVARKGKVVFNKAYGHFTQKLRTDVQPDYLYDLASITKIAATLPVLMHMQDEAIINVDSSLSYYLQDLDTTDKRGISIKDILGHQGRLFPWIPFYRSTIETDLYDSIYRKKAEPGFEVEVANQLFIRNDFADSVFYHITQSELREDSDYKYSDLGYYLFKMMIEELYQQPLEKLTDSLYYKRLGASSLGFLPLNRFSKDVIVPTEDDEDFRKQMLQGYVHDPGAAMLGGVGGHAGLFSNANDLAKMMQMYLQKGNYGGEQYFRNGTIDYFSSAAFLDNENRRGIGFDKPEMDYSKVGPTFQGVSGKSFGHTGFTGTMAWIDPEQEIVYIFLSNRICPDASNTKLIKHDIRTRIQEQIYKSIE